MARRLGLGLAALLVAGCGPDFLRDSVELDAALVPAIEFATEREAGPARAAMVELAAAWDEYRARYHDYRSDPAWQAAFAEIDTLVADVADLVADGDDLAFAAENLVEMRMMLAELRADAGIEHFPDRFGELWEPVAELQEFVRFRDTSAVAPADVQRMQELADEFIDILADIIEAPFDPERVGFDAARAEALELALDALADAGKALDEALAGTDRDRMLRAARAVRPAYFDAYRLFGDYGFLAAGSEGQ
ncbi:MAG: hypothetical protein R6X12_02600 [bacterium]